MKKKALLPLVALIVAIAAAVAWPSISKHLCYQKADKLLSEGAFEEARALYQQLDGYKDSAEKISQCNYVEAEAAFADQDYAQAYRLFSCNIDYQDSAERASECWDLQLQAAKVGDIVYMGSYEQDGNTKNGKEPIAWSVLGKSNNNLFLISESIIEKMSFGNADYYNSYTCTWKTSVARTWLSITFYQHCFSSDEKALIQKMITSNTTDDYVFLLSAEEANGFFTSDDARIAYITSYVKDGFYDPEDDVNEHSYERYEGKGEWWTRSNSSADGIKQVEKNGNVRAAGCAVDVPNKYGSEYVGIRPAICINILGETSEEAQNVNIFGSDFDSNIDIAGIYYSGNSGGNYSSSAASKPCPNCNGTGYVKYYYGSSDLEAILSGHDPYTTGKCTMCGGTGKW